jgi:DNA (cytosine-5)-methyltransferase 1
MSRRPKNPPTTISLFTGAGGLDFGLEAAGFDTRVAVELDAVACRTLRLNRSWEVLEGDICAISSQEILQKGGLKVGEVDLLAGGPPCQPFSKAGYWRHGDARRLTDPRANTLTEYLRVLEDTRPRAFLLENVPGIAFSGKSEGLQYLEKGIGEINRRTGTRYGMSWRVLNATDYGVPQLRQRVFIVGSRDGLPFQFPDPKFFAPEDAAVRGCQRFRTAWDALADSPAHPFDDTLMVRGKWADLLPSVPEGQNYLWHTARGEGEKIFGWRTRYWSFLLKLAKNKPAWTIPAQPGPAIGPFHWNNRHLTAAELCRLQTFPKGLKFACSRNEVQRLLGNAVPSLITEILGWEIRQQLLGLPSAPQSFELLPPARRNCPPAERVKPVAKEYAKYIGHHAEHPGTGLGPGARLRAEELARLAEQAKMLRQQDLFSGEGDDSRSATG